jgi:hypothetical protein
MNRVRKKLYKIGSRSTFRRIVKGTLCSFVRANLESDIYESKPLPRKTCCFGACIPLTYLFHTSYILLTYLLHTSYIFLTYGLNGFMIRPLPFFLTDVLVLDPADVEEASQRPLVQTPQSPPISATAQEEEISLLLGTLQVRPLFQ